MANPFVFRDYRGLVQLRLSSPEDLQNIHQLEPARWSSTSVPVSQILCDEALLRYLDTDENGRIRVQELCAAHDWLKARLKNMGRIVEKTDTVNLDDLDGSSPEAAKLKALVKKRMKATGQTNTSTIALSDIRSFRDGYAKKFPNGDGVVAPSQIADADLSAFAKLVVESSGGDKDISGEDGVSLDRLDAFLKLCRERLDWEAIGQIPAGKTQSETLPFGADTEKAFSTISVLADKLEQFFAQCDLLGQGQAAEEKLAIRKETLADLDAMSPAAIAAYLQKASIAHPNTKAELSIDAWLNPLYAAEAKTLIEDIMPRALGIHGPNRKIDRASWQKTRALFEPYRVWQEKKPRALPSGLSGEPLAQLVSGPLPEKLRGVVAEDQKASAELIGLSDLEKLALLQRWILDLANNMVSFPALFAAGERCLFEVGTLVLDGREINLCIHVEDKGTHRPIADSSNVFVAYVELDRKEGTERKTKSIAAGVTSGTRRGIAIGKRGVFYDREGKEWDAKVTDVIVKPISILEAAIAPFEKLRDLISDKMSNLFGKRMSSMEEQAQTSVGEAEKNAEGAIAAKPVVAAPAAPAPPPPAAPHAAPQGNQGMLVGGGIAFAAVGSAAAFALQTLANINPLNALLALSGVVIGIMIIAGFLGWLKLRKRDISTLLEASGWAFNVRIYLRRNLSLRFTRVPPLPEKSIRQRSALPAFVSGEDENPWPRIILFIILAVLVIVAVYERTLILERIRLFAR